MFKQIQKNDIPRNVYREIAKFGFPSKDFQDLYYVLTARPKRLQHHPDKFWDMWDETNRDPKRPKGIFSIAGLDNEKYFRLTINPNLISQAEAEKWVNDFLRNED